ncbi:MAG: hypothetical protein HKO14_01335, partial [Silicimonas sp.]|nr:hypothetical protein [Silicimonas sp.]
MQWYTALKTLSGPQLVKMATQSLGIVSAIFGRRRVAMALSYDFDMHSVMPTETLAKSGDKLGDSGKPPEMLDQNVALFRDPVTADALRGASEAIRKCFVDSGFGL